VKAVAIVVRVQDGRNKKRISHDIFMKLELGRIHQIIKEVNVSSLDIWPEIIIQPLESGSATLFT